MKQMNAKEIVQKLKNREKKDKKGNITFRLRTSVIEQFKATCKKQGVPLGLVIEELMQRFIEAS